MITVTTVPSGTASATTATYAVQIKEPFCGRCCASTTDVNVNYSIESQSVTNGTVVATIKAVITNTNKSCDCCCAHSYMHVEHFPIALTATDTNSITLTASTPVVTLTDYRCCVPKAFVSTQTLVATIS